MLAFHSITFRSFHFKVELKNNKFNYNKLKTTTEKLKSETQQQSTTKPTETNSLTTTNQQQNTTLNNNKAIKHPQQNPNTNNSTTNNSTNLWSSYILIVCSSNESGGVGVGVVVGRQWWLRQGSSRGRGQEQGYCVWGHDALALQRLHATSLHQPIQPLHLPTSLPIQAADRHRYTLAF